MKRKFALLLTLLCLLVVAPERARTFRARRAGIPRRARLRRR